ncbi:hypothetical protein JDV02_000266 [Purpureocillium takamizusanense]|uniref:Uncharacterized protein n=1 Tax=Purpureocillium takamizusanense TaxID=2060973 RepID=A0A9Q8Q707_9HYPO|nr:uncharacterized protein JDV02_000266 [Purpureocillium takamizusanense]UNI13528.1 hypothetical protein JDV02_000266 [Purpureocillium takamizusanense]
MIFLGRTNCWPSTSSSGPRYVKTPLGKFATCHPALEVVVLFERRTERKETLGVKESESLVDTAVVIGRAMREPTREPFHPVGHIAVEWFPERDAQLGLPETTAWVKSLYISWALQATGLGRAAMAALERVVEGPPFGAECVALDTLTSEFQLREEQLACFYDARGVPRPAVVRSNEEWYRRQGYEAVASKDDAYDWVSPATGETIKVPCVFMRKYVGGVA